MAQYGGAIGTMVPFFLPFNERHPNNSTIVSITKKFHTPTASVVRICNCTFANNTAYLGAALAFTSEKNYNTFTDLPTSTLFQLIIQNTKATKAQVRVQSFHY